MNAVSSFITLPKTGHSESFHNDLFHQQCMFNYTIVLSLKQFLTTHVKIQVLLSFSPYGVQQVFPVLRMSRTILILFAIAVAQAGGPSRFCLVTERTRIYAVAELPIISSSDRSGFLFSQCPLFLQSHWRLKICF